MTDHILAIVQARSNSSRFPRKVLKDLHGKPLVIRQLERISLSSRIDQVVVATSFEPTDDELVSVLDDYGAQVRRGPLDDVLARFAGVVEEFSPSHVVRLTADCPLTDPSVIDRLIDLHVSTDADFTSNAMERTFPHGLDAECMKVQVFSRLSELELTASEREHVTLGIYTRPAMFTLASLTQSPSKSHLRWTVDYPEDLTFVRAVYDALFDVNPAFGQGDVLKLLDKNPDLVHTAANVREHPSN